MKVLKWLDKNIEIAILTILTSVVLIAMFVQIVLRFLFKFPLPWVEELSTYSLVWLCYFGGSLAVTRRKHMRIEVVTGMLSPKNRKIFDIISDICFFLFICFAIYFAINITFDLAKMNSVTIGVRMPKALAYGVVPVAFILTLIRLIQDLRVCFGELRQIKEEK